MNVFNTNSSSICSLHNELDSNTVLRIVSNGLISLGFEIERSKSEKTKSKFLFYLGKMGKWSNLLMQTDIIKKKIVIEVEAGRAVTNYQFLKDLFQACVMSDVDYLVIAVRNIYRKNQDFEKVISFFNTLYASGRLILPLKGILIIGY